MYDKRFMDIIYPSFKDDELKIEFSDYDRRKLEANIEELYEEYVIQIKF